MGSIVGIIMPMYNAGKFISRTLDSLLKQTYQDWKLFIVDNASTDNSVDIIKAYQEKDSRILLFSSLFNSGIGGGRNIALKEIEKDSSISYIAILDADDVWFKHHLKDNIKLLEETNSGVVYSDCEFRHTITWERRFRWGTPYYKDFNPENLRSSNFLFVSFVVMTKSVLEKVGYFDETIKAFEDWDYWCRAALIHKIKFTHNIDYTGIYCLVDHNKYLNKDEIYQKILNRYKMEEKTNTPEVSIVIPTYQHCDDLLKPCLESIIKNSDLSKLEILIVANGCTDNTKEYVNSLGSPFRLIWSDEPLGYTKATNVGIKEAKSDHIMLLNNDCIILDYWEKHRWVDELLKPFKENDKVGMTGPMYRKSEIIDENFFVFFCVLIARKVFDKIGLLNEIYNPGAGEDTEFTVESERAGFISVPVSPNGRYVDGNWISEFPLYHKAEGTMHDKDLMPEWTTIFNRNTEILRSKYNRAVIIDHEDLKKQDEAIYKEIFESNSYLLFREEAKGKRLYDIGANVGMFTLRSLELGIKDVIAVDPHPKIYERLKNNVKDFPSVHTWNLAVSREDNAIVKISDEETASHISNIGFDATTITLESLMKKYKDSNTDDMLLKMDCEGAEYDVIFFTPKELIRKFKHIYCEVHTDLNLDTNMRGQEMFHRKMVELGYRIVRNNQVYCWNIGPNGETFNWKILPCAVIRYERIDGYTDDVTAVVCTRDRYDTTLPLTLSAIANQTIPARHLIIYEDGEHKNLYEIPLYQAIFKILQEKGTTWEIKYGNHNGQVENHNYSIFDSTTEFIWRVDDDEIPESNTLELLLAACKDTTVGAVGGLVLDPNNLIQHSNLISSKIEDIYFGVNEQWVKNNTRGLHEVDHLYSSFLYRRAASSHEYPKNLSRVGHREETIFTYEMKRSGWKIMIEPLAVTWHLRNPNGGIRSETDVKLWEQDEEAFKKMLKIWKLDSKVSKLIVLDNGLGDHLAFKKVLPDLQEIYDSIVLATCYPEVFDGCNVRQISIEEAKMLGSIEPYSIYLWMEKNNWRGSIVNAYRKMYF